MNRFKRNQNIKPSGVVKLENDDSNIQSGDIMQINEFPQMTNSEIEVNNGFDDVSEDNIQPPETASDSPAENQESNDLPQDAEDIHDDIETDNSNSIIQPDLNKTDVEPILKIPVSDLRRLFKANNILPVPVHGIFISINLDEFEQLSSANPTALSTVNALSATLEKSLTIDEVMAIRDRQIFSFRTGTSVMEASNDEAFEESSLELIIPDLSKNLTIEEFNIENIDLDEDATMIDIIADYRERTHGLDKILKKSTVVTILNMIQEETPYQEFMFYTNLISKMPESNSFQLMLMHMRGIMQYALNCDTLSLQSVMTNLILTKEE